MRYTKEQLAFVKKNRHQARAKLTVAFNEKFSTNKSVGAIKNLCFRNRWLTNRNNYFKKGHIPFNKGKKGLMGANITSFKKGNRPQNVKKVGSITRRKEQNGYTYQWIKTGEPNVWKMLHIYIWEQAYGTIPKNKCVIFKDKNSLNISTDNLMLVTRDELARLNQKYTNIDESLKEVALKNIQLRKKIKENVK